MMAILLRLFRLPLSLLNALMGIGGALLVPGHHSTTLLLGIAGGIAALAAGASALNQASEHRFDRLMQRTSQRPIPVGVISPATATRLSMLPLLVGSVALYAGGGLIATVAGGIGVLWYLLVYTPLKRRTPLALLAGGICGALPPLIGWFSAGGVWPDHRIMIFCGIIYLWQIPHFWLLQRRHADDYRTAGFPTVKLASGDRSFKLLLLIWIISLGIATMLLPILQIIPPRLAPLAFCFLLPLLPLMLISNERPLFSYLNLLPLLITVLFIN